MKKFLLVVVIVIIIASFVIGSIFFSGVQKIARDAKRKADIDEIAKALEVNYGNRLCFGVSTDVPYCGLNSNSRILLSTGIPINPNPGGASYYYNGRDVSAGSNFILCAFLETNTGNNDQNDGSAPNPNNQGHYYCKRSQ